MKIINEVKKTDDLYLKLNMQLRKEDNNEYNTRSNLVLHRN